MGYYKQFNFFHPLKGVFQNWAFPQGSSIIYRARSILSGRTAEQIRDIAYDADSIISTFFDHEKESTINLIKADGRYDLLEGDKGRVTGLKGDSADEYGLLTSENTSDLDALKEAMGSLFDPAALEIQNLQECEYFAVLALWLIGDCVEEMETQFDLNQMKRVKRASRTLDSIDTARLARHLIEAMDAVCYAEKLREVDRVESKYESMIQKIQIGSAVKIPHSDLDKIREEMRREIQEQAQQERREQSVANNQIRHQENREMKQLVLEQFAMNPREFDSAEKAADHFVDILEQRKKPRSHRTVADWIREYARNNGIRFR